MVMPGERRVQVAVRPALEAWQLPPLVHVQPELGENDADPVNLDWSCCPSGNRIAGDWTVRFLPPDHRPTWLRAHPQGVLVGEARRHYASFWSPGLSLMYSPFSVMTWLRCMHS